MGIHDLKEFSLVGGTALSLLYGHRKSEYIDLFSNQPFENDAIINALQKKVKNSFVIRTVNQGFGIFGFIEEVKVDFIAPPHPLIRPLQNIDGIRMFSTEDIIAMKVQAILGRSKKKDFWDIAELLHNYTISNFINFHKEKYSSQNLLIKVPQALTYFADAEESEDPVSLKKQTWDRVKHFISAKVNDYLK
jgi:hypothetical protein